MNQEDYLLRNIEKFSAVLAYILALQKESKLQKILEVLGKMGKEMNEDKWKRAWQDEPELLAEALTNLEFEGESLETLLKLRDICETAAECYGAAQQFVQTLNYTLKARILQVYLLKKGFVVWREENKIAKYDAIIAQANTYLDEKENPY